MSSKNIYSSRDRDQRIFYLVLNSSGYLSTFLFGVLFWWMDAHPYLYKLAFLFFVVYIILGFAARVVTDLLILFRLSIIVSLVAFTLQILWTGGIYSPSFPQLMIIPILTLFYKPVSDRYLFFFLTMLSACLVVFLTTFDLHVFNGIPLSYKGLYAVVAFCYVTVIIFSFIILFRRAVTSKNRELVSSMNELTRTTQQLVESEKMATIGQMMAGIAHELNNPINYIRGSSFELIRCVEDINKLKEFRESQLNQIESIEDPILFKEAFVRFRKEEVIVKQQIAFEDQWSTLKELMDTIKFGTSKTAEIITSLGIYARSKSDKDELMDINRAIKTSARLVRHLLPAPNCLKLELADNLPVIRGNEGRISQVILNLLVNAVHAIDEKGIVFVSTDFLMDDRKIQVQIQDSGPGIPKDIQSKIFDPFFTTKEVGKGTGLGLSISRSIVEDYGGRMQFTSDSGGTVFVITLPIEFAG